MADRLAAARRHLRRADPMLATLIDQHPHFDPRAWLEHLIPRMDAFGALLCQIAGQQLSVSSARAIVGRIQDLFGGRIPGPREFLDTDARKLRAAGLSGRKVETLRDLARRFERGELTDRGFARLSDEEIETSLTAVSGIGPWTVSGFLIIYLDRPDVLPVGDLALRKAVRRLCGLSELPEKEEFQQIAEHWRPYRTLAVMYLFESEYERANVRV